MQDVETVRAVLEERQELLRGAERAVTEQERRLARANNIVDRARAELRETAPASAQVTPALLHCRGGNLML